MASVQSTLNEIAQKLNLLKCICANTAGESATLADLVVEGYQPTDCNGDNIGPEINVLPVINIGKVDSSICNYQQVAEAIALAIEGGVVVFYNEPIWEYADSGTWNLSDNNDISTVHSISITVGGTAGGTVKLAIDGGTPIQIAVGFSYNLTVSSTINKEYALTDFAGGVQVFISGSKSL